MPSPTTVTPSASSSMTAPPAQAQAPLPPNALNVFAQRLNNSAALCIEIGQYDRAVGSLQRALKLSEKHMNYKMSDEGVEQTKSSHPQHPSQEYTLDGCIAFSDANSLFSGKNKAPTKITDERSTKTRTTTAIERSNKVCHGNKRRRLVRSSSISSSVESNSNESSNTIIDAPTATVVSTTSNETDYYVYGRPIRIPRQSDDMGSVLFLIILFNLALAHHLKASTMTSPTSNASVQNKGKTISKALMLYQLVFQYWSKLQHKQDLISNSSSDSKPNNSNARKNNNYSSIRFLMILQNNLGQMYQWTNNPSKEKECLRDLLSTVLVVTDQTNQHGRNSSSRSPRRQTSSRCSFQRDLEGFLENTGALTVDERCAEAA